MISMLLTFSNGKEKIHNNELFLKDNILMSIAIRYETYQESVCERPERFRAVRTPDCSGAENGNDHKSVIVSGKTKFSRMRDGIALKHTIIAEF